jgi:uncharacterized protein (DUF983 family)
MTPSVTSSCPACGGRLTEPISGDVHCYVECTVCGERFDLKDPRIEVSGV